MPISIDHRSLISVQGSDKETFLQGLVTNDVRRVYDNKIVYTAFLTPQGKFLYDLFIIEKDDHTWLLDVETQYREEFLKKLSLYKLRSDITLSLVDDYHIYACDKIQNTPLCLKDPRSDQMGCRLYTMDLLESESYDYYDEKRIRLAIPDGSKDMLYQKSIILECNLDELHAIDWQKGCYMGQELIARTKHRGLIRKKLKSVSIDGPVSPLDKIMNADGKVVGEIRSSCNTVALAMIRLEIFEEVPLPTLATDKGTKITLI